MHPECPELARFLRGEITAADFPHREHVRMAFEMLRRYDFAESVWLFSKALRMIAAKADKPQAFNQTVTIAFLSLIAERMEQGRACDFAVFARDNPEVFDKEVLARWYTHGQLAADITRRVFVLPAPAGQRRHATPTGLPAAPVPAHR
jgi:hypothetical protein